MKTSPERWLYRAQYRQPDDDISLDQGDDRLTRLDAELSAQGGGAEWRPSGWAITLAVDASEQVHHLEEAVAFARIQARGAIGRAGLPPAALVREDAYNTEFEASFAPEPTQLLSAGELAERLAISRQRLSQIRHQAWFPAPVKRSGNQALWDVRDIAKLEAEWVRRSGPKKKMGVVSRGVATFQKVEA